MVRESLFVIDKGPGPTSFEVVQKVKRLLRADKVGHSGSLDPFASGALVVLVGKATKLSGQLLNADKSYDARLKLGEATDTADRTGEVTQTLPAPLLSEDLIRATLKSFIGTWNQTPPMYSAKKFHGVRLYELARQQIHVPRPSIPVQLYSMEFLKYEHPYIDFRVHCSKGTYIRSLAEEVGKKLGTVAHLAELRRLTCGEFNISESVTLEGLAQNIEGWSERAFGNYIRLIRSLSTKNSASIYLQTPSSSGNSLLN